MANPFGSGTAIVIPLPARKDALGGADALPENAIDEASTVRVREPKAAAPQAAESPEVTELVSRILEALTARDDGMTAVELRVQLNVRPDHLQRALAAGLRARRLRRSGSRCRLRYLLNA